MMRRTVMICLLACAAACGPRAFGDPVLQNAWDNGYFTPFTATSLATVKYGDSGWLGGPGALPIALDRIDLGLVGFDSPTAGTADVTITVNNGDPSGLVFGNGAQLFSTTLSGVTLPSTPVGEAVGFTLSVPLAGVTTAGGFNNVGWSVRLSNYAYSGRVGFQTSKLSSFSTGFGTNNASYFNGTSWSLFSFGSDPDTQSANFVATVNAAPEAIVLTAAAGATVRQGAVGRPYINSASSVTKTGSGTVVLDALNNYYGPTSIQAGTLKLDYNTGGTVIGTIAKSSTISVAAGATFDVSAPTTFLPTAAYFLEAGQALAGAGTVVGSIATSSNSLVSPGSGIGALTVTGNFSLAPTAEYAWQLLDATGTTGGGWDVLDVGGSLSIDATPENPISIDLWTVSGSTGASGQAANFNASSGYAWTIARAGGGIVGFDAAKFRVVTTATRGTGGFANPFGAGTFSVAETAGTLQLVFTSGGSAGITINVASGTQTQTEAGYPTLTGTTAVLKTGAGTLVLDNANPLAASMTVQGGRLRLANGGAVASSTLVPVAGGTVTLSPALQTTLGGLAANAGGLVDVGTGLVTVAAGLSQSDMLVALVTGRGDGSWNGGSGITSSTAAASGGNRTVGWLNNGDGSVTFGFAAAGDTNLDWSVDILDAANFLAGGRFDTGLPATWIEGDFGYDGVVDILDAADFLSTGLFDAGPYNAPATEASAISPVPEPALPAVAVAIVAGWRLRLRRSARRG
jgi:autotransporter-associated beta strand protein